MRELFVAGVVSWWIGDAAMVLTPFRGIEAEIPAAAVACFAPKDEARHVNSGFLPVVRVRTIVYRAADYPPVPPAEENRRGSKSEARRSK